MRVRFMPDVVRALACAGIVSTMTIAPAAFFLPATPAFAQTSAANSMTLLWTASGDDGDQGQVSGYEARFRTTPPAAGDTLTWWNGVPSGQRITLGPPRASAGADDSTKVTGLSQNTTYYFVIRAFDEQPNYSAYSNVATGTTASCNAPSAAPTGFGAVADTGQVTVSWGATSDPLALSLHLYRAQGSTGAFNQIQNLSPGTTSFLDTSVLAGTTYRYRAAYMGTLCEGPTTGVATVTLPGTPPPPPPAATAGSSTIHAYPNPASSATGSIRIVVDVDATVATPAYLRLFDLNGHWVATLADGNYPPGKTEVAWNRIGRDGRTVGPGYYEILGTIGITRVRDRIVLLP